MGQLNFPIARLTDKEIVFLLDRLCQDYGKSPNAHFNLAMPQHVEPINGERQQVMSNQGLLKFLDSNLHAIDRFTVTVQEVFTLSVTRKDNSTEVNCSFTNQKTPLETANKVLTIVEGAFRPYRATPNIDKVLGEPLAEFYQKREAVLLRLENVAQSVIEQVSQYRIELDAEYLKKVGALESAALKERQLAESESEAAKAALQSKQNLLDEKLKQLDDRSSRHARRELRERLKAELAKRTEAFSLTPDTIEKRRVIHITFFALLGIFFALLAGSLYHAYSVQSFDLESWIRSSLSTAALTATGVFYIRWNDAWFKRHADEEFRLKRLELDIDRASWVVEMALEWSEVTNGQIPDALLTRISQNLFLENEELKRASHPTEDLASALLGATSGLKISLPGGAGELAIDRRGMRNFRSKVGEGE